MVKSTVEISQNFVAFSEYMNFKLIGMWVPSIWSVKVNDCLFIKFGLSEKHTKFEKNLPHALDVTK